ncbi:MULTISPECIES: mechanosensitive ion channel family protein [Mycobacterium]|uniref:Uncharacterized protein n=1 Tax=Mycobacterium syngnathidarum TaxID=1908205 RepID=A0A1S1K1P3_9MYCO|nr:MULTISPECIES: hypothetical protein [Mycobacterium]MCG7609525.1 hypothetical protein [Mycobacterium sp. CnD-18-1]OHT97515.1 hypothetical protein BKG61_16340 [Mycobacterium syngnathidarum]
MSSANLAIDFEGGVSEAWTSIATFVPKLLAFLAILVIGWIIAKIVARIVKAILGRIGFDRVVERGGLKDLLARSNYDASGILAKLAYYAILLITLQMGFGVWGPNPVSELLAGVVAWLPKLFIALVIIVIIGAIAKGVKTVISDVLGGLSYGDLLGTVASLFVWGIGIIAALNQIGVATTVTTPVLIAVLATIGGVAVVGVGGGLVRPMQERWDRWLGNIEAEIPAMRSQAEANRSDQPSYAGATQTHAAQPNPDYPAGAQQLRRVEPPMGAPDPRRSDDRYPPQR